MQCSEVQVSSADRQRSTEPTLPVPDSAGAEPKCRRHYRKTRRHRYLHLAACHSTSSSTQHPHPPKDLVGPTRHSSNYSPSFQPSYFLVEEPLYPERGNGACSLFLAPWQWTLFYYLDITKRHVGYMYDYLPLPTADPGTQNAR